MGHALKAIIAGTVFSVLGIPPLETRPSEGSRLRLDGVRAQLGETKPTIALNADDEHVIKEIILSDKQLPRIAEDIDLTIRAQVPPSIALQPFPELVAAKVPKLKAHQFFIHANQVIIVDSNRRIAEIVD
jgi:hypothetical protein